MATTNITIRIDEDLKREAEELFEDLGVTFTTVLISCIKQSVREQRIPFAISRKVPKKRGRPRLKAAPDKKVPRRKVPAARKTTDDLKADD